MKRIYNLDYLRGLAAGGIMVYHICSWVLGEFSANSFMGRIGIYGVSIFYILSGLTLFLVYYENVELNKKCFSMFVKKRIYRIFPLLWLTTILTLILSKRVPNATTLFLNLTGIFGFVRWDSYYATGVWSIGNELVFYFFFPFFIVFTKRLKLLMVFTSIVILVLFLLFTFYILMPVSNLEIQFRNYVNPLNQILYFLGGFLVGYTLRSVKCKNLEVIVLLIIALALMVFYPTKDNFIFLVTGVNRLIFTACCFLICISFYKLEYLFPDFIHKPLKLLGEASYSVYLLHPIVYNVVNVVEYKLRFYFPPFSMVGKISVIIFLTIFISYFVYEYFEKYFMKLGKMPKKLGL